jgi:HPt (histidine-containing phosphotransfer) domain-containing protein
MDDEGLVAEIIGIFLDDIPKRIARLREHLDSGQTVAAGQQAHSIKGAAADVGGEIMRAVAFEMEKAGKEGDLETLRKTMPLLEKEFERLKEAMKS